MHGVNGYLSATKRALRGHEADCLTRKAARLFEEEERKEKELVAKAMRLLEEGERQDEELGAEAVRLMDEKKREEEEAAAALADSTGDQNTHTSSILDQDHDYDTPENVEQEEDDDDRNCEERVTLLPPDYITEHAAGSSFNGKD